MFADHVPVSRYRWSARFANVVPMSHEPEGTGAGDLLDLGALEKYEACWVRPRKNRMIEITPKLTRCRTSERRA